MRRLRRIAAALTAWSRRHLAIAAVLIAFGDSFLWLLPPDGLIALSRRWHVWLACTVAATLGAAVGWTLGCCFVGVVGTHVPQQAVPLLHRGAFCAVAAASFTPIPFKLVVLAAGASKAPLLHVLAAATLGRGLRFAMACGSGQVIATTWRRMCRQSHSPE